MANRATEAEIDLAVAALTATEREALLTKHVGPIVQGSANDPDQRARDDVRVRDIVRLQIQERRDAERDAERAAARAAAPVRSRAVHIQTADEFFGDWTKVRTELAPIICKAYPDITISEAEEIFDAIHAEAADCANLSPVALAFQVLVWSQANFLKARDARVTLEARIAALEARPTLRDGGIWRDGESYMIGDVVTHDGSCWVERAANPTTRPGHDASWRLMVKKAHGR